MRSGTVHETVGGRYTVVLDEGGEVEASLRGRLKRDARTGGRVVVGDEVRVVGSEEEGWTIEEVLPRRTQVVRASGPAARPKVIAANVERALVVVSAGVRAPRRDAIDRLLVLAASDGIEARLVINKMDLPGAEEQTAPLVALYEGLGYAVLLVSARQGTGLETLRSWLGEGTATLLGPSGAGKSSLLNALEPGLQLRTGALSGKGGQGRHTTVGSRLIPLARGGRVADTPGFADSGIWGVEARSLDMWFPEMSALREECRFRACTHLHEPGCAVQQALADGQVDEGRFASYRTLREELLAREETRPGRDA